MEQPILQPAKLILYSILKDKDISDEDYSQLQHEQPRQVARSLLQVRCAASCQCIQNLS